MVTKNIRWANKIKHYPLREENKYAIKDTSR